MISHIVNRKRFTGQSHYLDSLAYGVLSRVMVEDTSVLIPGVVQTKKIIVASVYYLPLPTACIQDEQVYCGSQPDTLDRYSIYPPNPQAINDCVGNCSSQRSDKGIRACGLPVVFSTLRQNPQLPGCHGLSAAGGHSSRTTPRALGPG